AQGNGAEADAAFAEEPTAGYPRGGGAAIEMVLAVHRLHSLVIVSSRFSSTRDTTVHAPSCRAVAPDGIACFATSSSGLAPPSVKRLRCLSSPPRSTAFSRSVGNRATHKRNA